MVIEVHGYWNIKAHGYRDTGYRNTEAHGYRGTRL